MNILYLPVTFPDVVNAYRIFGEPSTNLVTFSHSVIRKRCLPTPSSFRAMRINRARVERTEEEKKGSKREGGRMNDEINTDKMIFGDNSWRESSEGLVVARMKISWGRWRRNFVQRSGRIRETPSCSCNRHYWISSEYSVDFMSILCLFYINFIPQTLWHASFRHQPLVPGPFTEYNFFFIK